MPETIEDIKTEEYLSETEALIKIIQIADSDLDLKEVLDSITEITACVLKKDKCFICFFEQGKAERILGILAEEHKPLIVEDITKDLRLMGFQPPLEEGFFSVAAVPILRDNELLGALILQTREPYKYLPQEINILTIIAQTVSTAIKNAELRKNLKAELRSQLDELKVINEVAKAITAILSLDKLLPYICEQVTKLFHARGCVLRLREGDVLQIKAFYGLEVAEVKDLYIGEGLAGQVVQTGESLLVDDTSKLPENLRILDIEATSVLCVPMKIGERVIGTLCLYDKIDKQGVITTFTQKDIDTLSTFASTSSIAIENARLYEAETERESKIMSLYHEVIQTKDYMESLIENSADAIITSDIKGLITSWNKGAENIYGFTEEEVIDKFLPMVPQFLIEDEKKFIEKILQKETLKNIEIIRQTKNGELIEVSLTLSPIIDSSGNVTGISGISRDVSERKRVERELIRKNQELSRLFFINFVIRSTLDLGKLLRMVLSVVTMSDGLGFNRAILFLLDEETHSINGILGVGPSSPEEAGRIWLSLEGKSLEAIIEEIDRGDTAQPTYFDTLSKSISIAIDEQCILSRCIREKRLFNIKNAKADPRVNPLIFQRLGTEAFGVVPLITRDKAIGVILVDNLFTGRDIRDEDLGFMMGFTSYIASAIENARLFEEVSLARAELHNIFESITDMIYFNDKDYTIKHVNQSVLKRLGKPAAEIIGKKCYQVFHGLDEPWSMCPHSKTISTGKSFVEEVHDHYLGSTFVVSSSPIFDSTGKLVGTVHISRDITELKNLRERLAISERMAILGEMAARVAHEIRNPLVSVGGFARRLGKKLNGELQEYAKIIANEVNRLENILKEILDFVKSSREVRSPLNINELIDNIINFVTSEAQEKDNNIIKDISDSPLMITADTDRIRAAILNILTNANEATEHGTIIVRTSIKDRDAVIEISDTGCGIKQEDLKNIFNPFFTTKTQGTGLGLAVTQRIIQDHKGRIEIESVWGGMRENITDIVTTFRVYLPLEEIQK